jgi:hypothetical protein
MGRGQILAKANGLVEVGRRFRPCLLIDPEIAAGQERQSIVRLQLDRLIQIGARQIETAAPLAQISAQQQSRDKMRIQLKRGLGVAQRQIQFRAAGTQPPAIEIGLQSIVRRTRRIIDHRAASRLDLVEHGAIAVFQFARADPAGCRGQRDGQQQRG